MTMTTKALLGSLPVFHHRCCQWNLYYWALLFKCYYVCQCFFLLTLVMHIQVGCPLRCSFCATGKGGFARNLQPHEIVEQVLPQQSLCLSSAPNVTLLLTTLNKYYAIAGVGHRGDVQTQGDKCCVHGDG